MAKLIVFALLATACFAKPTEKPLDTLAQNAKNLANEVSTTLGLQNINSEKILKTINDQSRALADNLNTIVDKLKGEVSAHQGEVENVLREVETKLTKTANDLKSSLDPKTQTQIDENRQKLEEGVQSAAAELNKLVKSIQENKQVQAAQTNLKSIAQSALDTFIEGVKDAEKQLKKAVSTHEKTHQH